MAFTKRLFIALIFGVVAGVICGWGSISQAAEEMKQMIFWSALLNRAFIGFVIGISAWRLGWVLHGIVIGFLGSLPLSFPLIFNPDAGFMVFIMFTVAGIVWGFFIELLTTVVFKAPMKTG